MSTPANLSQGLVLYLPGDVSGTTAYDASGSGNNGTMSNVTTQRNNTQKGFVFNGSSSNIGITSSSSVTIAPGASATFSFWIYINSAVAYSTIMHKGNESASPNRLNYIIDLGADGLSPRFAFADSAGQFCEVRAGSVLTTGKWYHIAIFTTPGIYNSTGNIFYINGVSTTLTFPSSNKTPTTNTDNVKIGSRNTPTEWFNGTIYNMRMYNRELKQGEIQQLYYSEFIK